ncbi:hypothetical protein M0805_000104 [Coniferiporia weirii]|nr:hypothetical protein M0805_000104 [Coniferiporia weirii]
MLRPFALRLSTSQRRSFISSLFTATFFASIITVAASSILPCPARKPRVEFAGDGSDYSSSDREFIGSTGVSPKRGSTERKTRRWIEEKPPGL